MDHYAVHDQAAQRVAGDQLPGRQQPPVPGYRDRVYWVGVHDLVMTDAISLIDRIVNTLGSAGPIKVHQPVFQGNGIRLVIQSTVTRSIHISSLQDVINAIHSPYTGSVTIEMQPSNEWMIGVSIRRPMPVAVVASAAAAATEPVAPTPSSRVPGMKSIAILGKRVYSAVTSVVDTYVTKRFANEDRESRDSFYNDTNLAVDLNQWAELQLSPDHVGQVASVAMVLRRIKGMHSSSNIEIRVDRLPQAPTVAHTPVIHLQFVVENYLFITAEQLFKAIHRIRETIPRSDLLIQKGSLLLTASLPVV